MADFEIGDVVWVRAKVVDYSRHPGRLVLEVGNGALIANESDCKASHEPDLKQSIREVLLSKEFLAAFSRAYMETPCIPAYEINLPPTIADTSAINQHEGESK